jgi:hypothetical protein
MILGMFSQQAKIAAVAAGGIQFVGGKVSSAVAAALSFDFASLTGGTDTSPSVGDYVIVVAGWSRAGTSTVSLGTIPVGLASVKNAIGSDSIDASIHFYGGFYEAGTATGGSVNSPGGSSSGLVAIYVFRGVDATTPLDATTTSIQRTNGCDITLSTITPVTAGAVIVGSAVAGHQSGSNTFFDPIAHTYEGIFHRGSSTTYDGAICIAHHTGWTTGVFSPGLFDFNGGDSLSSAASVTIALRPA